MVFCDASLQRGYGEPFVMRCRMIDTGNCGIQYYNIKTAKIYKTVSRHGGLVHDHDTCPYISLKVDHSQIKRLVIALWYTHGVLVDIVGTSCYHHVRKQHFWSESDRFFREALLVYRCRKVPPLLSNEYSHNPSCIDMFGLKCTFGII